LSCQLFADALASQLADFGAGLDADINIPSAALVSTPQTVLVSIVATNPYPSAMPVYILRQEREGWQILKLMGALAPNSRTNLELEVELAYQKETKRNTRYTVVARGEDGRLYGKYFEISENWEPYEKEIKDSLSSAIVTYIPALAAILVVLVIAMAKFAYGGKSQKEYDMRTLVFPDVEGKPFEEKLADVLIHPLTMLFEIICVSLLVLVLFESLSQPFGTEEALKIMLLSGVGALAIPFIYFAAAWFFDRREEGKPLRFFAGMFVWGMFAAFLSLLVSSSIVTEMKNAQFAAYALVATMLIAPVVEEVMKGLGVLFVSGHHEYNDTLTGLLLGFTCGVGFAFVENWFYFSAKVNPFDVGLSSWGVLILYRSFFNTLAHGCFTAAVSTPIGYLRGFDKLKKYSRLAFIPGILLAISIHTIFNLSALADGFVIASQQVPFFVFNPMLIILLAAMFFLVLVLAVIDEKKRKMERSIKKAVDAQANA